MNEFINYQLFQIGSYTLEVSNLIGFVLFQFAAITGSIVIKKIIYRSGSLDEATKFSVNKLLRYIIGAVSIVMSLHILGFNISVLLAGSVAIMVGLGFGLQNLFNDFISGIILLLDSTLKVGDIIEVNGTIYRVMEINFRTTKTIGRDDKYVILPNSQLTANSVVNWTHHEVSSRFSISIGVDYSSDIDQLTTLLRQVADRHDKVLQSPAPFVRFEDYGDSSLMFSLYFYTKELFRVESIKSELRMEIFRTLKEHNIVIPFPQRVVHLKRE